MNGIHGITVLESIKKKCESIEYVSRLYLLIEAIKSVLLKYQYDNEHPLYKYLEETKSYFEYCEKETAGIGVNSAKEIIIDIIDTIIVELQTFYINND